MNFFTAINQEREGDKNRQARLDEIDRLTSAQIQQAKALSEQKLLEQRLAEQQKYEAIQESLFQNYKAAGASDSEAMQQSMRTINEMKVASPMESMTSAQLITGRNQGAIPLAPKTGELQEQATATGAEADKQGNIARGSINQALGQAGPAAKLAELGAAAKGFSLAGAQADAQQPYVNPLATATNTAQIEGATNEGIKSVAERSTLPSLIKQAAATQLATGKAQEVGATNEVAAMPPVDLMRNATTADLKSKAAVGNFQANNPVMGAIKGMDFLTLQSLINNPELFKSMMSTSSAPPPPVTPSGIISRPGTNGVLRVQGNAWRK